MSKGRPREAEDLRVLIADTLRCLRSRPAKPWAHLPAKRQKIWLALADRFLALIEDDGGSVSLRSVRRHTGPVAIVPPP